MTTASAVPRRRPSPLLLLAVVMLVALPLRPAIATAVSTRPALSAWVTTFVSMSLQALPFLVVGVLLSAAISVLVPPGALERFLPSRPVAAVPVAGAAGMLLPGCECASVPVSGALVARGIAPAVALTFQLAAPAVNPVVLASTAVAFGGDLHMVAARFLASWLTAVVVGWAWLVLDCDAVLRLRRRDLVHGSRVHALADEISHDVLHAGGFLVVGAALAATVSVVVPREWVQALADRPLLSVLALAVFAIVLAVCSEADAFVAAGLGAFSPLAQLAFLVVGPVVDIKLVAMQVGTYGPGFVVRFVPLTLVAASACTLWVGSALL